MNFLANLVKEWYIDFMQYMKFISKNRFINDVLVKGDIKKIKGKMYIYLIEPNNNIELLNIIKEKYNVLIDVIDIKQVHLNGVKYYKIGELCGKGEVFSSLKLNNAQKLIKILNVCYVTLVSRTNNIQKGLKIVDETLSKGREVICIKGGFMKENYMSNYLIKNGAKYI